jgi:hypothetical protein
VYIYLQRQRLQSFVKLRVEHFIFYMYFCSFFMSIPRRRLRQKIKKYQRNVKISSAMELCAPIERASLKSIRGKTFPLLYILILSRLVFREFIFFFYSLARAWKRDRLTRNGLAATLSKHANALISPVDKKNIYIFKLSSSYIFCPVVRLF